MLLFREISFYKSQEKKMYECMALVKVYQIILFYLRVLQTTYETFPSLSFASLFPCALNHIATQGAQKHARV